MPSRPSSPPEGTIESLFEGPDVPEARPNRDTSHDRREDGTKPSEPSKPAKSTKPGKTRAAVRPGSGRSRGLSVVGVVGELFMTFGVIMLAFVGWKYWLNDIILGHQQNQASSQLISELVGEGGQQQVDAEGVPIGVAPELSNERFAILYVPSFGQEYMRPIAQGTGYSEVLNANIGHYVESAMPGEVGNFAIAGHRLAYGASMQKIHELKLGDEIIVETAAGWYTYHYRSGEYVLPTEVQVLDDLPHMGDFESTDRVITLQSCNPYWSTDERIIAYGLFDHFTPRADGPPASIQPTLALYGVS